VVKNFLAHGLYYVLASVSYQAYNISLLNLCCVELQGCCQVYIIHIPSYLINNNWPYFCDFDT